MRKFFFIFLIVAFGCIVISNGQDPEQIPRQLYTEAQVAREKGDFDQAENFLVRILEGRYELPEYRMAQIQNELGVVYFEKGSYQEAFRHYRIAENLSTGAGTHGTGVNIDIYNNLALFYNEYGDYHNAIEYYDKAIRLLDSAGVRNKAYLTQLSRLQLNKGIACRKLGKYEDALHFLKESERVKETYDHPYRGSVYFNIALVYQMLERPDLSRQYFEKSIHQWISEFDSTCFELGNVYRDFGRFLIEQEDIEQGTLYFQKALRNYLVNCGPKHPVTSECYEQIGRFYLERSDFGQALEYIQQSLISVCPGFGNTDYLTNPRADSSLNELTLLRNLALKTKVLEGFAGEKVTREERLKFLKAALETSRLSTRVLADLQQSYHSKESRIYLTSGQKDLFAEGVQLNLKIFRLTGEESYKEQACLTASMGKASELLFEMNQKERLFLESLSDTLVVSALSLKQQMDKYLNLIQVERNRIRPDSLKISRWQEEVFTSRRSYQQHLEKILEEHPEIGHFKTTGTGRSMKQIRQNLGRKETLLEYFISGPGRNGSRNLFIFAVSRKNCDFFLDTLGDSFVQNLGMVIRDLHQFVPYRESVQRYDSLKRALYGLYEQLLSPVEPYFTGHDLIIVPDEELAYLPFDALIDRYEPEPVMNYPGLPYLVNRYRITYAYNSGILEKERPAVYRFPEVTALVPDYSQPVRGSVSILAGASEEVDHILKVTDGKRVSALPDKIDLIRWLEGGGILHLAMHAMAGDEFEGSSYLILDSTAGSVFSSRIYDYEINALNLSSPMVVLSACETGGGWFRSGEGILSLSRSFVLAGAESVVYTLWPVEDVSGSELMYNYYRELKKGRSKGRAISQAKKSYLAGTPPSFTHPYYWAAYQVTGDPAPLIRDRKAFLIACSLLMIFLAVYLGIRRIFRRSA